MMLQQIISFAAVVGTLLAYILYKGWELKKERAKNARLEAEKAQKEAKIQQQKVEVKNAKTQQKHTQNTARISSNAVDMQLHQHGYFRDDGHGLHGVSSAVSKQGGYSGDQASDTGSQSDL